MKDTIQEHDIAEGWYAKPHCLIRKVKDKYIAKTEYIFLDLLLHFENRFTRQPNQWFFVADKRFTETRLISAKTLVKARKSAQVKGLIAFKQGRSHEATQYRVLIDGTFYYRGTSLEKGSEIKPSSLEMGSVFDVNRIAQ